MIPVERLDKHPVTKEDMKACALIGAVTLAFAAVVSASIYARNESPLNAPCAATAASGAKTNCPQGPAVK